MSDVRCPILVTGNERQRTINKMRYLSFIIICFVIFCGGLIIESGVFQGLPQIEQRCITLQQAAAVELQNTAEAQNPAPANEPNKSPDKSESSEPRFTPALPDLSAVGGPAKTIIIGAKDPKTEDHETGYKFQLELSSIGAGIRKATFSNGPHNGRRSGFNARNHKDPHPLVILSPVKSFDGRELLSMANKELYLVECKITIENMANSSQHVRFGLLGPLGLEKEDFRADLRKVIGSFLSSDGQIVSSRHNIPSQFFSRQ